MSRQSSTNAPTVQIGVLMALLLVITLAGCSTSANHHSVYFSGTVEAEDGQFIMDGNVSVGIGAAPDATFDSVTVVLYDENKEEIRRVPVGELSTTPPPLTQPINITADRIPEYVVIESPDFWTSDATLSIIAYERPGDGSRYKKYPRLAANQKFPDEETDSS